MLNNTIVVLSKSDPRYLIKCCNLSAIFPNINHEEFCKFSTTFFIYLQIQIQFINMPANVEKRQIVSLVVPLSRATFAENYYNSPYKVTNQV